MEMRQCNSQKAHGDNKFRLLEAMENKVLQNNIQSHLMYLYLFQLLKEPFLLITQGKIHKSLDSKSINSLLMILSSKANNRIHKTQSIIKNFLDSLTYLKFTRSQFSLQRIISMV